MIISKKFWDDEKDAPILKRNSNFISKDNYEDACKRAGQFYNIMLKYIKDDINVETKNECNDKEILRIIRLDAERTFTNEENRTLLIEVLKSIYPIVNDYHQGMSFVSSFLLLFLKPKEVTKIVIGLHKHYLQGYFKAMPKAYVRDSRVFLSILNKFHSNLYEHIQNLITPEAFVSKWFIGLNVHVLTFESLMLFFEELLKEGEIFLFKYSISLCRSLEKEIMKTKDVSKLLALLRLDASIIPNDYKQSGSDKAGEFFINIIKNASKIDMADIDLDKLRDEASEQMRIEEERRKKFEMERSLSDEEIIFSDEIEDEESDKDSDSGKSSKSSESGKSSKSSESDKSRKNGKGNGSVVKDDKEDKIEKRECDI
ncbi:GTPase-activating protein, putative [Plasmodium vinckei brucechwatti]|uniref:GTPase-activating protein, putative n=1 Tax=Plasmodium vinckei brucechwatti TaxID=119398 RepID=A0A6V7RW67_PLAVN|nr:GTPase-activating protein, putative [Plasmodium vinckei brucechwatti]